MEAQNELGRLVNYMKAQLRHIGQFRTGVTSFLMQDLVKGTLFVKKQQDPTDLNENRKQKHHV